jgi:ketosteroid isomerase-like protein
MQPPSTPDTERSNPDPPPDGTPVERTAVERLLHRLYAARIGDDLHLLCSLFAADATFRIAGSSDGTPISIVASGEEEIRPWLGILVKTFRISRYQILSMVIENPWAAVQWRANIHSRVTGASVATEFVDIVRMREGRIVSYVELFVPD